jgi:hypothetical protein
MMLGVWRSACDPNYVQEWTEEEKVIQDEFVVCYGHGQIDLLIHFRDEAEIC